MSAPGCLATAPRVDFWLVATMATLAEQARAWRVRQAQQRVRWAQRRVPRRRVRRAGRKVRHAPPLDPRIWCHKFIYTGRVAEVGV